MKMTKLSESLCHTWTMIGKIEYSEDDDKLIYFNGIPDDTRNFGLYGPNKTRPNAS